MPGFGEARDLLLVIALAALMVGTCSIAAGLQTPTGAAAPSIALAPIIPPAPFPIAHRPARSACECDERKQSSQPLHTLNEQHRNWQPLPQLVRPPEQSRSREAGSFEEWARLETDTRHLLTRMATLSRHAPRAHATKPPQSFAPEPTSKTLYPD
jgi:hypothetical protein